MRNLLALLAAVVLLFGGFGLWRDWYSFQGQSASAGKVAFRVEIDGVKVVSDVVELFKSMAKKAEKDQEEKAGEDKSEEKKEEKKSE